MFCKNCGTELSQDVKFCPNCGKAINQLSTDQAKTTDDTLQFQLKPTFKLGYKFCSNGLLALLYAIIFLFILGEEYIFTFIMYYPIFGIILFAIILFVISIKLFFEYLQYQKLEYNFYNSKIEYKDGFLNIEEKELKYKYIREVTMKQNILERLFGIGTIHIFTNATSGMQTNYYSRKNMNGIHIHCVENVQDNFKKIRTIIDNNED